MKLALFFTKGVSLNDWIKVGNFDGELKPYKRLLDYFDEIYFLTYGKNEPVLEKIKVLLISSLRKELRDIDIFKTNQMNGSWVAVMAKKIFKKKLVIRQGYQWSIFTEKGGTKRWKMPIVRFLEKLAYKNADAIIVSSRADKKYIEEKYNKISCLSEKINYIPNYIDTDLFKPLNIGKEDKVCFVGRLEEQKNLFNLIKAISELDIHPVKSDKVCAFPKGKQFNRVKLVIFGNGSLKEKLENFAKGLKANVEFKGNIPNKDLVRELNKSRLFVLPSFYEGCPKVLLEAMACGVPVIGANVYGIKEIIKHKENGYLCGTDVVSIKKAITQVLSNKNLQEKIKLNARKTILQNFSLEKILEKEIKIYENFKNYN